MKKILLVLFIAASAIAQPTAPNGGSGRGGRGGFGGGRGPATVRSPQVMTDGRVTLRFRAPDAKVVNAVLEPGSTEPMTKGPDGVWSVTVGPLDPDIYAYRFTADGVNTPDPASGAVMKTARPNAAGELGPLGSWQSQF